MKRVIRVSFYLWVMSLWILTVCFPVSASETGKQYSLENYKQGRCGVDAQWEIKQDTLYVKGNGSTFSYYNGQGKSAPWYVYESDIKKVVVEDGIITLGAYVFANLESVEQVVLPNSLQTIDGYAFFNCRGLLEITVPDSVEAIGEYAIGYYADSWGERRFKKMQILIRCSKDTEGYDYAINENMTYVTHKMNYNIIPVTCDQNGKQIHTCSECGYRYIEEVFSDGHSYDAGKIKKSADLFTVGVAEFQCDVCKEKIQRTIPILTPQKGMVFTYQHLVYQIISVKQKKQSLRVLGYDGTKRKVVVPDFIIIQGNRFLVEQIGKEAFLGSKIKEIELGKNIGKIYDRAFYRCKKLSKVTFTGKNLTHYGKQVFAQNGKKIKFKFPKNRKKFYQNYMK